MAKRGLRVDRTGRSVQPEKWCKVFLATLQTPAWRALSPFAQRLYPWLLLEWHGAGQNNNGRIQFSVRQAAEALRCNRETARRALADLQRKGFMVVRRCACLGLEGEARGHEYEITELGTASEPRPRRLYLQWDAAQVFPVVKAKANNPTGIGGLQNFGNLTYGVSTAQLTEPEEPNLRRKSNGTEKGDFPTYSVSHPYIPGGAGEAYQTDKITTFAFVTEDGHPRRVGVRSRPRATA